MKKQLKQQNKWANLNIIDVLAYIDPTSTNKYLPLLIKEFKRNENGLHPDNISSRLIELNNLTNVNINSNDVEMNDITWHFMINIFNIINRRENITNILNDFNNHLIENRIKETDIQKYDSIDEIIKITSRLNTEKLLNETKSYVHKLIDTDDYLGIIPLTFETSLKYGASTKWCTASKTNPSYYYDTCSSAALVYLINRKTHKKFGIAINVREFEDNTFDIYNEMDQRIDSFTANIDHSVMKILISDESTRLTTRDLIRDIYPEIYETQWLKYCDEKECNVEMEQPVEAPLNIGGVGGVMANQAMVEQEVPGTNPYLVDRAVDAQWIAPGGYTNNNMTLTLEIDEAEYVGYNDVDGPDIDF